MKYGFGFDTNDGGGGGGGTVTSFSAGNLSPLFTTSVANAGTTPSLTFALVSQNQNLVYASPNGSSGSPSFRALVANDLPNTVVFGSGTTGKITKWTASNSVGSSSVLEESGTNIIVTNGSLFQSANLLNSVSIGNIQVSLDSDNGIGTTGQMYSAATVVGGITTTGSNICEFYADSNNNVCRINASNGGDIIFNTGTGTITATATTITLEGSLSIDNGAQVVGRVFACTNETTGAGTWQALSGLISGATGDLISFSAANTQSNISAVASGSYLRSAGASTIPVWSTLKLPNSATANYIPYTTSTNTWGESSLLKFDGTIFTANALKSNASGAYIGSTVATSTILLAVRSDQNGGTLTQIENQNSGTAARSALVLSNGTSSCSFQQIGTGYTTSGIFEQNAAILRAGTNLNIGASSGIIKFYTNGDAAGNERMRIDSSGNVGIGTTTISARLHVISTTEQLRIGYDASNYYSTTISSAGAVTFDAVGASAGFTFNDSITLADAKDLIFNTTTGTKIGTATTQKIGFWNTTPIVQPTTAIAAATFAANTSAIANDTATFDGYTIGQVVKALRNIGILQ